VPTCVPTRASRARRRHASAVRLHSSRHRAPPGAPAKNPPEARLVCLAGCP
jgi:hypothetical protein